MAPSRNAGFLEVRTPSCHGRGRRADGDGSCFRRALGGGSEPARAWTVDVEGRGVLAGLVVLTVVLVTFVFSVVHRRRSPRKTKPRPVVAFVSPRRARAAARP